MSEVTRILSAIGQGDPHAAPQLLPLIYDELRQLAAQKLAQEKPGQTFQATALVHEAYLRLVDTENVQHWDSRGPFFAAAAEAMRRILVEQARRKGRQKRGRDYRRVDFDGLQLADQGPADDVIALDEAMRIPFKVSTTTSNFMIGVTAAASVGLYLKHGYIDPGLGMPVMLGVLAGAFLGARLLPGIKTSALRHAFSAVIAVLAVEMIYQRLTGKL